MAEDAQIAILIRAVDEFSGTLKNIETQLTKTNRNITKQTEETGKAFDKQTGSLLILGQAANSVDNIFSQYRNLQLRLENATERVSNAQDRLSDSQIKLTRLQQSGTATTDQLHDAEQELERATRGLTISQNNLERTQNMVIGTYISIGTQVVSLLRSMPLLIVEVRALTISSLAFIATPLGATLLVIGAAIALVTIENNKLKTAIEDLNKEHETRLSIERDILALQQDLSDSTNEWAKAIKDVDDAYSGFFKLKSREELDLGLQIANQELKLAEMRTTNTDEALIELEEMKLTRLKAEQEVFDKKRDVLSASLDIERRNVEDMAGIADQRLELLKMPFVSLLDYMKIQYREGIITEHGNQLNDLNAFLEEKEKLLIDSLNREISLEKEKNERKKGLDQKIASKLDKVTSKIVSGFITPKVPMSVGDAIIRPNGQIIETDPRDTLIATKGGIGGITFIVQGNLIGLDEQDIARRLVTELQTKIRI